jgi:sulfonate transport system permease protein
VALRRGWAGAAIGLVLLVGCWWLVAATAFRTSGAVPTPAAVVGQFLTDGFDFYWSNAAITLRGAALGFLWGNALALAIAVVVLLVPAVEGVATQLAVISYCVPLTAIGPIILVVFGGRTPTVFLAALSVFFTTLIGALLGLRAADRASLDAVTAFGGSRWHRLVKVQLIAALPATLNALKIAVPAAMLGAIVGEYLGGVDSGLGVVLTVAQQQYEVARTWALALLTGLLAFLGYGLVALAARLVTPWAGAATGPSTPSARGLRVEGNGPVAFLRAVWRLVLPLVVSAVVVLALWIAFLEVFDISRMVGKPPTAVWAYLVTDDDAPANRAAVLGALLVTLRDAAIGFTAGLIGAVAAAVVFVLVRSLERTLMPVAMLLRSVPLIAMTPIIALVFGRGLAGVAVIGAIVVFFPVLVNVVFGMRSASSSAIDLVQAYGGGRVTALRKVALPSALPALFASARIAVPGALIGALIAEWLITGDGMGGAILRSVGGFRYDELWASVVVLTATSIVCYTAVGVLEAAVLTRFFPQAGD